MISSVDDMRRYYSCLSLLKFYDRYKHCKDDTALIHVRDTYNKTKAKIKSEELLTNLGDLEERLR